MSGVTTSQLTKQFGENVAVDHIDMDVPEGCVFGLLGPNGAGKSTTVRLLSTLLKPTSGTAVVASHDILKAPVKVRESVGILPEEGSHTFYPTLSVLENLRYYARLYGVPEEQIDARIEELLRFMELWERRDDRVGELSTGNRQRLALCRALLHGPRVVLLDEPTASLDPVAAGKVRDLIMDLARTQRYTFFINSHNLAEVQRICDHIAIIDGGKILLTGKTAELRKKLRGKQEFRLRVVGKIDLAEKILSSSSVVEIVKKSVDTLIIRVQDPLENNTAVVKSLIDGGVKIVELAEEEVTLEDIYLQTIRGGTA
ncbi:MAG: ABC transporter ATP-binding protein [Candidatus Thorarchaeota archaeon]